MAGCVLASRKQWGMLGYCRIDVCFSGIWLLAKISLASVFIMRSTMVYYAL